MFPTWLYLHPLPSLPSECTPPGLDLKLVLAVGRFLSVWTRFQPAGQPVPVEAGLRALGGKEGGRPLPTAASTPGPAGLELLY